MNYKVREGAENTRDLRERTKYFALQVIETYSNLPKSPQAQVLGHQVLRSGTSVGANYREAWRARSRAEFISNLGDCLKELDETAYWLELLAEFGIVRPANLNALRDECNQLIAIFTTSVKTSKNSEAKGNPKLHRSTFAFHNFFNIHPAFRLHTSSFGVPTFFGVPNSSFILHTFL